MALCRCGCGFELPSRGPNGRREFLTRLHQTLHYERTSPKRSKRKTEIRRA